MKQSRFWKDPGLWLLGGMNAWLVYYYYEHPQSFTTLIWLYWAQSVSLGFFNFLDIATISRNTDSFVMDEKPAGFFATKMFASVFFLFHYGFFHVVYFFFLFTIEITGPFQLDLFEYCLGIYIIGQIAAFIQHKRLQRTVKTNVGMMFFTPYIRIIPMHLTILAPAFFKISNVGLFLILKAVADVAMYVVTRPRSSSRAMDGAMLASQQAAKF